MAYTEPEPLDAGHEFAEFACGVPALDEWLLRHAIQSQQSGLARVFVTTDGKRVIGYYALAAAQVVPAKAPERFRQGQPRNRPIPVALLARLAVDQHHQGIGVGRSLLQNAMLRCEQASDQLGIKALLVHAKDEDARRFYERFGFEPSPTDPLHLLLLMKDLRAFLRRYATHKD